MSDTEQQSKTTLRPAQVTATTLAATTGAFLAAQLGVYGTVIGVGVISLLSTIGSEIYLRSLERTKQVALARAHQRNGSMLYFSGHHDHDAVTAVGEDLTADVRADDPANEELTQHLEALPADTEEFALAGDAFPAADPDEIATVQATALPDHTAPIPVSSAGDEEPEARPHRLRWPMIAAGAVVTFVLAMLVITGIEAATGSRLSGGDGSTIGTVFVPDRSEQPVDEVPPEPVPEDDPGPAPVPTTPPTSPDEAPTPEPPADAPVPVDPPAEDDEPGDEETVEPPADEPPADEEEPPGEGSGGG